jgi:hypothetical protein
MVASKQQTMHQEWFAFEWYLWMGYCQRWQHQMLLLNHRAAE